MRQTPALHHDDASPRYGGWRVVLVCFVMALFCWGLGFYGHAINLAELQRLHGWPAALISGASSVYYLVGAALVVFVSDAIARLGPRLLVLTGIACLASATVLIAFIDAPWQLYAVYLVMAIGWASMSLGAINNILGLWFDRRRGLAIALALSGASFSDVIIVPALIAAIDAVGFAIAMPGIAAIMVAVLGPLVILWIDRPAARTGAGPGGRSHDVPRASWTRATALTSFAFWTASAPFALGLVAQVGFIVHQVALLEPAIGRSGAGVAVAITTAMAVVGRLAVGVVVDRLDPRMATAISLITQAAALAAMTQTANAAALYAACAVFGFSVGNLITFPTLIFQREFEAASFGMLIGLSTAVCQFTYAFGPGLLGLARDLTSGYGASLALCIALEIAAAGIVLMRPSARTA